MKRIVLSLAAGVLSLGLVSAVRADEPAGGAATTPPASAPMNPAPSAKPATTSHHHSSSKSMLDLNTASKESLMKLPGITDATAQKIIAARPFKSKSELESKSILTKAEYEKIHSKVTVNKKA